MNSIETFFEMGGYAWYVWPSFAISAGVLTALYVMSRRRLKSVEQALEEIEGRRGKHPRKRPSAPQVKKEMS